MTQEEKARAYDEALERAKFYHGNCPSEPERKKLEEMFPQLRESEDERIRKEMIAYFAHRADVTEFIDEGEDCKRWISYLEKQKEQKPIDYPYLPGWRKNRDNNKPELKRSVLMLTTHGVAEGEWLGEKWCQYRWSCELKDGEVLYWIHLSDLERLGKEGEEKQKEQKPMDKIDLKFNIGDTIVNKKNGEKCTISNRCLLHQYYSDTNHCHEIKFDEQDDWELVKEQKPAEKPSMLELLREHLVNTPKEQLDAEFEELKEFTIPKPAEWSEEDEKYFKACVRAMRTYEGNDTPISKWIEALKDRVCHRPHWKPSEEQMEALEKAMVRSCGHQYGAPLSELYEQLRKL